MKAISIRQPWATLISCGLKDIENRSWAVKNTPQRVLIHSSSRPTPDSKSENMFFHWMRYIQNYQFMGILDDMETFPTSSIVGVATIERCISDSKSPWAQPESKYHWVIKDAKMFKEPIEDVKGALNLFNVPEITEDNLPETVDIPPITREGEHLTIPFSQWVIEGVESGEIEEVYLNITDENLHLFATEDYAPLPTTSMTLVGPDGTKLDYELSAYTIETIKDADTGEEFDFDDNFGNLHLLRRVFLVPKS